jgi:pyridinium-3,5-biscarboxylic acid mononucleotide sulfurtransferase
MTSLIHIRQEDSAGLSAGEKERALLTALRALPSVVVALSGGADSAYLAWAAHEALGSKAVSVTALSPSFSAHDRTMLEQFVRHTGLRHEFLETQELENPAYRANAPDRCYFCKDELFAVLDRFARERQLAAIAYGMNADDALDFRPGHRAAAEHHVLAPLLDAGLRKAEIRELSRRAGLPTWDRPASACLSSRIPYGTEVTPGRLALVERGEAALRELGFQQFRVRLYGQRASVEVAADELPRAFQPEVTSSICNALRAAGFSDVTLDPRGYRQGSLNEALLRPGAKAARGT